MKIIIVEDILSCIRLRNAGYTAVCLLGTSLSTEQFIRIGGLKPDEIVIWLDFDAVNKAVKLQQRLSSLSHVKVIRSKKEPKELSDKEIQEVLNV